MSSAAQHSLAGQLLLVLLRQTGTRHACQPVAGLLLMLKLQAGNKALLLLVRLATGGMQAHACRLADVPLLAGHTQRGMLCLPL